MKTFEIVLTKSYVVRVRAKNQTDASQLVELFTSDAQDISTENDRKNHNFTIQNIDCKVNEAMECKEIKKY